MSTAVLAQDREIVSAVPLVEDCIRQALRRLRTRMLTRSGSDAPIRLLQAGLLTVGELLEWPEVRDGAAFTGFYVERGNVSGFCVLEGPLLERLTARLFGDVTPVQALPATGRGASDVELRVATRLSEELFLAIEAHWPVRPAPRLVPRKATPNRHGVADTPVASTVVAAVIEFGTEEEPAGRLTIALPAHLLRGVAGVVELPASAKGQSQRDANFDRVGACEVELVVELARIRSTLGALRGIGVGAEIPLGAVSAAKGVVNGRLALVGEPGACDGQRSFRVEKRLTIANE
ncbi:MAG: FliM/FliN family flagellar motor switch protein [Deltaproteobacteria bacterium]|nr:FliM/FliN family flagellar motor switch protein [Deltaproteobacteria bacterium]